MNEHVATRTVGELVAADFRAAAVFEQFGIDFCCSGRRTLDEACRAAAADPDSRGSRSERAAAARSTPTTTRHDGRFPG